MNCKFIFKNFNTLHCAKRLCSLLVCLIILCTISPFQAFAAVSFKTSSSCPHKKFIYEYGVFLNVSEDNISRVKNYHTVVIDAEYFSRSTIKKLKKSGHVVYTYLNIGSLEDFRKDYNKYKKYCIGKYEKAEKISDKNIEYLELMAEVKKEIDLPGMDEEYYHALAKAYSQRAQVYAFCMIYLSQHDHGPSREGIDFPAKFVGNVHHVLVVLFADNSSMSGRPGIADQHTLEKFIFKEDFI